MRLLALVLLLSGGALAAVEGEASRVVRLQIDYESASTTEIAAIPKWQSLLRSSLLASLRFINKHWLICGGSEEDKKPSTDCGRAHITGETIGDGHYRVNVTFIAERDPVRNVKVDATSTVFGVVQIGLKGGIFQYTNALKILGRPTPKLIFDEQFFCNKGFGLSGGDKCIRHKERRLADEPLRERLHPIPLALKR